MPPGWAVFSAEIDDLEMQFVPLILGEVRFEVALGLDDGAAARETPAVSEAMNVGVDGKGGYAEGLRHHHARGFVADAGEGFQVLKTLRHFSFKFFD